jgi:hypothetical protein
VRAIKSTKASVAQVMTSKLFTVTPLGIATPESSSSVPPCPLTTMLSNVPSRNPVASKKSLPPPILTLFRLPLKDEHDSGAPRLRAAVRSPSRCYGCSIIKPHASIHGGSARPGQISWQT